MQSGKRVLIMVFNGKLRLFALATCLIGGGVLAQSEQSKSELLEDLLSGSDVCVKLGYTSHGSSKNESLLTNENRILKEEINVLLKSTNLSSSFIEGLNDLREQLLQCTSEKNEFEDMLANSMVSVMNMRTELDNIEKPDALIQSELDNAFLKGELENLKRQLNAQLNKTQSLSDEANSHDKEQIIKLKELVASWMSKNLLLEKELAALRNTMRDLTSNDRQVDDLGEALTSYKRTVQRLLNEKKCKAGTVDGLIGTQTTQAANRFAYASNFPQKSNLVYDEGFFNHLNSSSIECNATATYSIKDPGSVKISPNFTNSKICTYATRKGQWEVEKVYIPYVQEAKRRGLTCGVSR